MKIIRFTDADGRVRFGQLTNNGTAIPLKGELFGELVPAGETVAPRQFMAPLAPLQIIAIGLNYQRHAAESGAKVPEYPVVFHKTLNTVTGPGTPIRLPAKLCSEEVDYECELALIIGRTCRNVSRADALQYVFGYTCANDVSARDWQLKRGGGQWSRGKSFDTFCPLGPCLVTTDEIPDPNRLAIRTLLNGQVVQDWNTSDMIFSVPALIEFLSADTTLEPGTVILTGTPHGVGMAQKPPRWLVDGDEVTVEIAGIGRLSNRVIAG